MAQDECAYPSSNHRNFNEQDANFTVAFGWQLDCGLPEPRNHLYQT